MKLIAISSFVLSSLLLFFLHQPQALASSSKHPYIYVTSSDIPGIKEKLSLEPFNSSWEKIKKDTGTLSLAFKYLITQNKMDGNLAIQKALNELKSTKDIRPFYNAMMIGSCVYDWCYPLMNRSQKKAFINEFIRIAKSHSPGYPASINSPSVVGHTSEGWLLSGQLPAGLAIYEENTLMYDSALRLFQEKFIPARNFAYKAHMHHQGDSYGATRFQHDIMASWLFKKAGHGTQVFCEDQQYVPYQFIYHLRPDGIQLRTGDSGDERGRSVMKRRTALLTAAYYNDPYLLTLADSDLFTSFDIEDEIFEIIFRPAELKAQPLNELPLSKYFPQPMGEMVARTGWDMGVDSDDAVVHMRIGNYFFGNHQHKDFGTFQFYYKGALAINSGVYGGPDKRAEYGGDHWMNYYHQTIAHNGLLVYDPAEEARTNAKFIASNDGGQYWPNNGEDHPDHLEDLIDPQNHYRMGNVLAYEYGPHPYNPRYSYLAGDITNAYRSEKVEKVTRSMVTLNTGQPDIPAVLVIYDKIISPKEDFKKTWLLHSLQEPQIHDNSIWIVNNQEHYKGQSRYAGHLIATSLLPKESLIEKVGGKGKEFWIESTQFNYYASNSSEGAEPGEWRVEVSPAHTNEEDDFLHILYASEKEPVQLHEKPTLIEEQDIIGTQIANSLVYFNQKTELLEKTQIRIVGEEKKQVFISGLKTGEWFVEGSASKDKFNVNESGQCAFLLLEPGIYDLYLQKDTANLTAQKANSTTKISNEVLYRINVGGDAIDGNPNWAEDTESAPSPYRNGGRQYTSQRKITLGESVPANTPVKIFNSERFGTKNPPPMSWAFPVEKGKEIIVRIYLAETHAPSADSRAFDIIIDEKVVDEYVDVFALTGGPDIGYMKSYTIVSDGTVDIAFKKVIENPSIKAIEIIEAN